VRNRDGAISNRPSLALSESYRQERFAMSIIDSMRLPPAGERLARPAARVAPRLSPFVEQALLFWGFAAVAGFWMAVIWWIVR
jgi:hypothetical protein